MSTVSLIIGEKHTGEAVQVDGTQQLEEADTVFWEFCKVLVNHAERRLEHGIHDGWYLGGEQRLKYAITFSTKSMRG